MPEIAGYILRIAAAQWVDRVFDTAIYYTSLRRRWKRGQVIIFIHKTGIGDAAVGYGVLDHMTEKNELTEEEMRDCEEGGWKGAIEFKYVKRFEKPLLIRETFLKDSKLRGRFFHGLELNEEQLESIVSQADSGSSHQKS